MIVLLDRVGDSFKRRRRMIKLTRNFNSQVRVPSNGIIVNRDPAISRDELAAFGQH